MNKEVSIAASMVRAEVYEGREKLTLSKIRIHSFCFTGKA